MNGVRLLILGVALASGGLAAYLATGQRPEIVVQSAPAAPFDMGEVLVAAVDIETGTPVKALDLRWQAWPSEAISSAMITRSSAPNAAQELEGAVPRASLIAGEPIRRDKLVNGQAGFMAAILPSGMRALAINIDSRGANSAGGFILPNDKVDVIRTYTPEGGPGQEAAAVASETVLKNVRVLAIGQNIEEKNGQKVVVGETATLELDPRQVEAIVLAQRLGQLSLSLRSLADNARPDEPIEAAANTKITIVRHGVESQR
jgi:pilus assembly protein CpaB